MAIPRKRNKLRTKRGFELLANSPYREQLGTARRFLEALKTRSKEIPELISPHLGDRVPRDWTVASSALSAESAEKPRANAIAALPPGGRIKVDPWNDHLRMLKYKPVGYMAESEKMPLQITPFLFYLTRDNSPVEGQSAATAKFSGDRKP